MNGVTAAENAGAQVTDDSHGFTEFHHHHLLRDSLSVNTRFKMMISTVDSGFDSGSSPELHMSSLEDPPMSRTHQYRKVNIDNWEILKFLDIQPKHFLSISPGHETTFGT